LAVFIAKREMVEQVLSRLNIFSGELFSDTRADAAHIDDWGIET
jgi:hypothetical protein